MVDKINKWKRKLGRNVQGWHFQGIVFGDVLGTFFRQLHTVRKDWGFGGEVMNPKMGSLKVNPKKIPKETD